MKSLFLSLSVLIAAQSALAFGNMCEEKIQNCQASHNKLNEKYEAMKNESLRIQQLEFQSASKGIQVNNNPLNDASAAAYVFVTDDSYKPLEEAVKLCDQNLKDSGCIEEKSN